MKDRKNPKSSHRQQGGAGSQSHWQQSQQTSRKDNKHMENDRKDTNSHRSQQR